jgi:hypothetical protein
MPGQKSTIARRHPHQISANGPAAGMAYGRTARTSEERETTRSTAAGKGGKGTRSGPGDMDAGATRTRCDADTTTAPRLRIRQHVGAIGRFVRAMEGRLQLMSGQRTNRRAKGVAYMWMYVGGRWRANRQGMSLVENDSVGGSMDGMPVVLGPTSDMPFVGGRT